jgi:hypothetical protein
MKHPLERATVSLSPEPVAGSGKVGGERRYKNWKISDQLAANQEPMMQCNIVFREATPRSTIGERELLLFNALILLYQGERRFIYDP